MKNRVEFVDSHSFTRGAEHNYCSLCNVGYDKWTYQYAKVVEGPAEGAVICPECLKAGNFSERAELAAQRYEAKAKLLLHDAGEFRKQVEWDVPTYDEWRKRETAADEAYAKEAYPKEWAEEQARRQANQGVQADKVDKVDPDNGLPF